jgi:hypothetical protein
MKKTFAVVSLMVICFVLGALAYAGDEGAATVDKHWLILKTKTGSCRLCQSKKDKTPASIEGLVFTTKEEATAKKQELIAAGECTAQKMPDSAVQRIRDKAKANGEVK